MNAYAKSGLTLAGVVLALALYFALRLALADGMFTPIDPVLPVCGPIAQGLGGANDLESDPGHGAMFLSAQSGLYRLALSNTAAAPVKLAGAPGDLHSVGISFYRDIDGNQTLMAIDRSAAGRYAVATFALSPDGTTLSQRLMIQGGLLVSPTDLAALSADRFYVGNDHSGRNAWVRFAEDDLLLPHADVILFNGRGLRDAVQRVASAHGVLATPDGRFLYVAANSGRQLLAFSIENFTGNLTQLQSLSLPARLEKISMDDKGNLIVAGRTKPGSAQVFRIKLGADGVPMSYETLFSDDGHTLSAANAAIVQGGHLIVVGDNKILDCAIK